MWLKWSKVQSAAVVIGNNLLYVDACSVLINAFNENPTVQRHTMVFWLIGHSKLPIGVNASVNGCLSLCVNPASGSWPIQGVPSLSPYGRWDRLPPEKDKRREWMDGMAFKEIKKSISVTETLFRLLRDNLCFSVIWRTHWRVFIGTASWQRNSPCSSLTAGRFENTQKDWRCFREENTLRFVKKKFHWH